MMRRLFFLVLPCLALAACGTVGPDYRMPGDAAANLPGANASFAEASDAGRFLAAEPPGQWWRLYDDPQLDQLVRQALQANTDLRQAQASLERMQAAAAEARGAEIPRVDVNATPAYGHRSGVETLQPDTRPINRWSYSTGLNVSYQLDLFGQIRRAIEAADADAASARATYDAARVTVAAETARAYAELCAAGMQLASARHSVDVQQASATVVERLLRAGRGTALDLSRARSQLAQLQSALPSFEARQRTALYQLAALTGHAPRDMPSSLLSCNRPPRLAQAMPVGDGAALLRRRPDIRAAERSLAAATARIGVATADLYPRIALGLSGASAGPANLFGQRGTYSWSLGPLVSWSLPNTGEAQARIAQARAVAKGDLARFDAVVLNALRETESALVTYARQLDRDQSLRDAREQSALAASQARRLYQAGKTDYLAVLDAERTLASSESELAASQAALSTDQIAVFLALGGGWQDSPGAARTGNSAPAASAETPLSAR